MDVYFLGLFFGVFGDHMKYFYPINSKIYNSLLSKMDISPELIPFISGGLAANTFWMISFPADCIKNKMMASSDMNFRSIASTVRWIWKNNGLKGFYRGFLPCMLRSFPTNGAAILVYELCMNSMNS